MLQTIEEQAIFEHARQISSPKARQAFLQERCGENVAFMQRLLKLLKANAEHPSFMEVSARPVEPIDDENLGSGTIIGHYKLLQKIGEGGMGIVYMAEQTHPVYRKVALKIIQPGMDSRQVIARFEAERQALAMMDHVNIARVIDGGTISSPLSPPGRGAGGEGGSTEGRP